MSLSRVRILLLLTVGLLCVSPSVTRPWILGFNQEPVDTRFANSRAAVLNCSTKAEPAANVTWRYASGDQQLITTNTTLRYVLPNGSLYFPSFPKEKFDPSVHEAAYQCLAENKAGVVVSRTARLRAVIVKSYDLYATDGRVARGDTALIQCVIPDAVSSYVRVEEWHQREGDLDSRYSIMPTGDLLISKVDMKDENQMFFCTAINLLTGDLQASNPAKIFVEQADQSKAPQITSRDHHVSVDVGETAELQCTAHGSNVRYTWTKNGAPIRNDRSYETAGEGLKLERVQYEDRGRYRCTASNSVGSKSVDVQLSVRDPLRFRVRPVSKSLEKDGDAIFECVVAGQPTPVVTWYKDGQKLAPDVRVSSRSQYNAQLKAWDFNLTIVQAKRTDKGTYQCFADNGVDVIQSSASFIRDEVIPTITTSRQEIILKANQAMSLSCQASAVATPEITWEFDGTPLTNGDGGYSMRSEPITNADGNSARNGTLTLLRVGVRHSGVYKCEACSVVGCSAQEIVVHVRGHPQILNISSTLNANVSQTARLHCAAKGYPQPTVTWGVHPDLRYKIRDGTLEIYPLRKDDAGLYSCEAKNIHGLDLKKAQLNVLVPPEPTLTLLGDLVAGVHNTTRLSCQVTSTSACTIKWKKDGVAIQPSDRMEIHNVDKLKFGFVDFKRVDRTLTGRYTCVATSDEGSKEDSKDLIVFVPPRFTEEPVDPRVLKTYTAHLTCKATAFPPPRIDWRRKSGERFTQIVHSSRVHKMLNGTLVIHNVTKADEGRYYCTAESLGGPRVYKEVFLHVHAVPATINYPPANLSGKVSTFVNASCVAFGNLPITVRWYNGSSEMKNSSRVTMTTAPAKELYQVIGVLRVDNLVLQDTRTYTCQVGNSYGGDKRTFQITAQDVPSPPSLPLLTRQGARFLEISWKENFNGNSPITGFVVEYSHADRQEEKKVGSVHNVKLTALVPDSEYQIRVRAENALGDGDWGDQLPVKTAEAAPSAAPESVSITAKSSTEILVKWQPPPREHWNGWVRGYFVIINRANTNTGHRNITVKGSSNSFVIKDLRPYTEYDVVVQAYTRAGVGPKTRKTSPTRTWEDVPAEPPQNVIVEPLSSTRIEVRWQRPPADSLNGQLLGYRVRYYQTSKPGVELSKNTTSNAHLTALTALAKFTKYRIKLSAFNGAGEGVSSDEIEVRTEEDVPGPPHGVRAVPVSRGAIRVLWQEPPEPNGIIREYTVNYSLDAAGQRASEAVQVPGSATFTELLRLEALTVYYFSVKAKTSKGYGVASVAVEGKTEDEIPAGIFDEDLPAVFAKRNGPVLLKCDAYGEPAPKIRWNHDERDLSDEYRYELLKNGSLRIPELQQTDGGEYECTATNELGIKTVTRTLKVQVPPSAPTNIQGLPSNFAINITWLPGFDGHSPISEFLLEFRPENGEWAQVRVPHTKQYYTHDVEDSNVQHFRMKAKNDVGVGPYSKVHKITVVGPGVIRFEVMQEYPHAQSRAFYSNRAVLGTLIAVSVLVLVLVFLSFVAYRRGYIDISKLADWRKRVFSRSSRGRSGHDDARPSASGPTTDSVCTSERLPTPDGSELSLPGSNPPLQFYYPHDTILEEDLLSLPPPYQSSTRLRSSLISRHGAPDDSSDTSSEVSCGRQVYHRPTMHPNDAAPHPRRYMRSADHRASVHRSIRSLSDASRVSSLGYRGHADGRSELDASSYSKSLELSNPELRYYGPVRVTKIHGQSHESLPPVFVRSSASMARDSGLGPSEFGRSSCHSRRSSTSSQVTYVGRPSPSPMRRDSASSRESTSFPVNGGKLSAKRERKAYDSTSSECSSSRDELMSALEFGKRHNLDRYYGIPTLETTSASSEATNTSSDLDGVCRFSASPRLHGHGCLAPIPVRPPPFNPRSRSRGSENYMYVPRGMSRDFVYVGAHNGSLV